MPSKLRIASLVALCLLSFSCTRISEKRLELPATPILSGGSGWGIVKSSYVRLKAKPDTASSDIAALRDGTEVEILGREFDKDGVSLWFRVRSPETKGDKPEAAIEGWVAENEVFCFDSREQSERFLRERGRQGMPNP